MFSLLEKKQLKDIVERILHVPGNFTGPILEMTLVLDHENEKEYIKETTRDIISTLKSKGETFRNVRLNVVQWVDNEHFTNEVTAMSLLLMDSYYEGYQTIKCDKKAEWLMEYLKKFHARSKLIIIVSDSFSVGSVNRFMQAVRPFLEKKTILVKGDVLIDLHRDIQSVTGLHCECE
ncbi:MAG: hypothetical protein PUF12_05730 [Thermoflexaceae bacterium]|nr:hypothetical protein [Thermoflexaceae bacterium]